MPGVLNGLTAWFSTSVPRDAVALWERHGGSLASAESAQYLFSDDAGAADTRPIFRSAAYEAEELGLFRSAWIVDSVQGAALKPVWQYALSPIVLPSTPMKRALQQQQQQPEAKPAPAIPRAAAKRKPKPERGARARRGRSEGVLRALEGADDADSTGSAGLGEDVAGGGAAESEAPATPASAIRRSALAAPVQWRSVPVMKRTRPAADALAGWPASAERRPAARRLYPDERDEAMRKWLQVPPGQRLPARKTRADFDREFIANFDESAARYLSSSDVQRLLAPDGPKLTEIPLYPGLEFAPKPPYGFEFATSA